MHIRLDTLSKQKLERAAAYAHKSLSEFVLGQALHAADELIQEHETLLLSEADWGVFLDALAPPPSRTRNSSGPSRNTKSASGNKKSSAWTSSSRRLANSTTGKPSTAAKLRSTNTSTTTPARMSGDGSTESSSPPRQVNRGW